MPKPPKYPKIRLYNDWTKITQENQKIENEERKEKLRRILESRKAKAANDQEKEQSAATNDNVSDMSNDAKKAK